MKRLTFSILCLALMMGIGFITPAQSADITINDWMIQWKSDYATTYNQGYPPPYSAYKPTPVNEDNYYTGPNAFGTGAIARQEWDLEGFNLNQAYSNPLKSSLYMVGGFNFMTGIQGYHTSDIMVDIPVNNLFNAQFGHSVNPLWNNSNAQYQYDAAIVFQRQSGSEALQVTAQATPPGLLGVWTGWAAIMPLTNLDTFILISGSSPDEAKYSVPYRLNKTIGTLNLPYTVYKYNDTDPLLPAPFNGFNYQGDLSATGAANIHYAVEFGYQTLVDEGLGEVFRLHTTQRCGNDMMMGQQGSGGNVPLPGAFLLLGAGLARLASYSRRKMSIN
jgi:hypothetical protein